MILQFVTTQKLHLNITRLMNKTELSCIELSEFFVSVAAQIYHPDMRRKPRNPVSVITLLKTQRQSLCPVITVL